MALLDGGCPRLHRRRRHSHRPDLLSARLREMGATIMFASTPMAELLMARRDARGLPLRALLTGGDALRRRPSAGGKTRDTGQLLVLEVNHRVEFSGFQAAMDDRVEVAGRIADLALTRTRAVRC